MTNDIGIRPQIAPLTNSGLISDASNQKEVFTNNDLMSFLGGAISVDILVSKMQEAKPETMVDVFFSYKPSKDVAHIFFKLCEIRPYANKLNLSQRDLDAMLFSTFFLEFDQQAFLDDIDIYKYKNYSLNHSEFNYRCMSHLLDIINNSDIEKGLLDRQQELRFIIKVFQKLSRRVEGFGFGGKINPLGDTSVLVYRGNGSMVSLQIQDVSGQTSSKTGNMERRIYPNGCRLEYITFSQPEMPIAIEYIDLSSIQNGKNIKEILNDSYNSVQVQDAINEFNDPDNEISKEHRLILDVLYADTPSSSSRDIDQMVEDMFQNIQAREVKITQIVEYYSLSHNLNSEEEKEFRDYLIRYGQKNSLNNYISDLKKEIKNI